MKHIAHINAFRKPVRLGIGYCLATMSVVVVLLLTLPTPVCHATTYHMYRVTLAPPAVHAFRTKDSGGDDLIITYVLEQIRNVQGTDQVIATRIGRNPQTVHVDSHGTAASFVIQNPALTLDIRRGDKIRVAVSLVKVNDVSGVQEILDVISDGASFASVASGFSFPAATPVLSVIGNVAGAASKIVGFLNSNDDLGGDSYTVDFPRSQTAPQGNLRIARPADGSDWEYQVLTDVTVWPEFQVLAGDFNGDGKTDIAQISAAGITLALAGPRGSQFTISPRPQPWPQGFGLLEPGTQFGVGDFNGDGKDDLVILRPFAGGSRLSGSGEDVGGFGGIWVARSEGNSFDIFKASDYPFYMTPVDHVIVGYVLPGHFNADIVIVENGPGNTDNIWLGIPLAGRGQRRFRFDIRQAGAIPIDRNSQLLAGDFNGDGMLDLVAFENGRPGAVRVASFTRSPYPPYNSFVTRTWGSWNMDPDTSVLAYDFNGDGKTDILKVVNPHGDGAAAAQAARDATNVIPAGLNTPQARDSRTAAAAAAAEAAAGNDSAAIASAQGAVASARLALVLFGVSQTAQAFRALDAAAARIATAAHPTFGGEVYVAYSTGRSFDTPVVVSRWPEWRDPSTGQTHPGMTPFDHILAGHFFARRNGDIVRFEPGSPGDVRLTPFLAFIAGSTSHPWEAGQTWAQWWSRTDVPVLVGDFDGDGLTDIAECQPSGLGGQPGLGKIWVGYGTGRAFDTRLVGTWPMR